MLRKAKRLMTGRPHNKINVIYGDHQIPRYYSESDPINTAIKISGGDYESQRYIVIDDPFLVEELIGDLQEALIFMKKS